MTGEQYQMCLPQHLNVDLAASGVTAEVKDLPRSITHVGSTSVAGEFKDLTASVKYLNGSGFLFGRRGAERSVGHREVPRCGRGGRDFGRR